MEESGNNSPGRLSGRLTAVDALRGFDMFWIIGADSLVYAFHEMSPTRATTFVAEQLDHADWAGFHFYDLIFPLFVFIAGISVVFSLSKALAQGNRVRALKRVFRRTVLLYALGIFYYGGFSHGWPDMRLVGVLDRIALCYFFASLIFLYCKPRTMGVICAGLLLGYWAIMAWVPIRDIRLEKEALAQLAAARGDSDMAEKIRQTDNPSTVKDGAVMAFAREAYLATTNLVRGKFDSGYNVSDHFDFRHLPGKKWDNFHDPEGILSTIPAIATCLLGVFCGLFLRNSKVADQRKVGYLFGAGAMACALGWLWGMEFPVIKKIWTSSYVLMAGGYSALLLGAFYQVVEIWKWQRWCQPFVWIGVNPITIYLTENILGGFDGIGRRLVGGDVRDFLDAHVTKGFGALVVALVGLLLAVGFARFLHRRKIFLRL